MNTDLGTAAGGVGQYCGTQACGGECGCDDCCAGIKVATPVSVANRPGLPALTYRVGTQPQFLASMRARLGSSEVPALAALTTREPSDLSMALLDGWATVADVLTFYTERIANEGFLRTATEEYSVRRLAELVGYRPRPGLSASAYLAFTVKDGERVPIPTGTKAQQIPGPGQLPATFETAEPVVGYGNLSALTVRRREPQLLIPETLRETKELIFKGNLTDLRDGDRITVESGNVLAIYTVTDVSVDAPADLTTVKVKALPYGRNLPSVARSWRHASAVAAEHVVARTLNGHNPTRLELLVGALRKPPSVPPADSADLPRDLRDLLGANKAGVSSLLGDLVPEIAGTLDSALANSTASNSSPPKIRRMRLNAMLFGAVAPKFPVYSGGRIVAYTDPKLQAFKAEPTPTAGGGGGVHIAADASVDEVHPTIKPPTYIAGKTLDLDAVYPGVTVGSNIVLINPHVSVKVATRTVNAVETVTANILGLSTKVSRLTLDRVWPDGANKSLHEVLDETTVLAQEEFLTPAGVSLDDKDIGCPPPQLLGVARSVIYDDISCDTLELDGLFPELTPGHRLIVAGERTDAAIRAGQDPDTYEAGPTGVRGGEVVMVAAVEHHSTRKVVCDYSGDRLDGGPDCEIVDLPGDTVHTFVRLATPLAFTYRRSSVTVYGNVAPATHGETRGEVLGSGDPTKEFARYPLKQPPLTYLPAPTSAGASAALEVFVDSVRWHEVDSLLDIGRDDRGYVIETDDNGNSAVVFGAARPPTGVENIRARYRSGIGLSGNAAAGSIATPLDQPLGVTAVTNPLPATGGANRDGRETVRRNAAVSVQALDRLVSASDYADFATAFAGIGAASAHELSDGRRLVVHVTIAGIDDAPIAPTSALTANLRRAMQELGDPDQEVQVAIRTLRALAVSAKVRIDPDRVWADVEPVIRAKLLAEFGPGKRDIASPITQSAVLAAIHAVSGVVYTDLSILDSIGETELVSRDPTAGLTLRPVVPAAPAEFDSGATPGLGLIRPAELLILSPSAPDTLILEAL